MGIFPDTLRQNPKINIPAVFDTDLDEYLDALNLLEAVERGEAYCEYCEIQISKENLGMLYQDEGEVKLRCDRPTCMDLRN